MDKMYATGLGWEEVVQADRPERGINNKRFRVDDAEKFHKRGHHMATVEQSRAAAEPTGDAELLTKQDLVRAQQELAKTADASRDNPDFKQAYNSVTNRLTMRTESKAFDKDRYAEQVTQLAVAQKILNEIHAADRLDHDHARDKRDVAWALETVKESFSKQGLPSNNVVTSMDKAAEILDIDLKQRHTPSEPIQQHIDAEVARRTANIGNKGRSGIIG